MTETEPEQLPEDQFKEAFSMFDQDGDGYITAPELKFVMFNLGEELSDEEIEEMMLAADGNGDGRIDYNEFVKMMQNMASK